jgi:hypothetical protein
MKHINVASKKFLGKGSLFLVKKGSLFLVQVGVSSENTKKNLAQHYSHHPSSDSLWLITHSSHKIPEKSSTNLNTK